jgi:2-dehydro-3-deoxygluconokinase
LNDKDAIIDWCFDAGARQVLLKLGGDGVIVAAATRYANAAAALTTTGIGAVAPIPAPQQVQALLANA